MRRATVDRIAAVGYAALDFVVILIPAIVLKLSADRGGMGDLNGIDLVLASGVLAGVHAAVAGARLRSEARMAFRRTDMWIAAADAVVVLALGATLLPTVVLWGLADEQASMADRGFPIVALWLGVQAVAVGLAELTGRFVFWWLEPHPRRPGSWRKSIGHSRRAGRTKPTVRGDATPPSVDERSNQRRRAEPVRERRCEHASRGLAPLVRHFAGTESASEKAPAVSGRTDGGRQRREAEMRISTRDRIATALVALAVVVYVLWATGFALPGIGSIRATGVVILGLGFAASASAVVPGFDELMRGPKLYLAVTSLVGLVAFASGVVMLVGASEVALGLVMAAMIVLWMMATIHHVVLAEARTESGYRTPRTPTHGQRPAGVS